MSGAGARGPIEVAFTYTEDEYVSAARAFSWRRHDPKFERALTGVFLAVLALIFVLAGDPYLGAIMLTFMLAALALLYFIYRVRPRRDFRRDPKFRDPYALTFAEEGVHIRSTDFEARFEWDYYSKVLETPEFFFLVYGEDFYSLLPKRALRRDRGEEAALRELLRRKFGPRMETRGLPEAEARAVERGYEPPTEPPDWR